MDPVSHVAFGRTLVALDTRRALGHGAVAACVLGSLMPDIDAVLMPIGWDVYLRQHQGGTHSLLGSLGCAALTALLVGRVARSNGYCRLVLAAWAGALGHLLLDVISGADVGFFWPFGTPVALPLFAMADPWLGAVLVAGLLALLLNPKNPRRIATAILVAATVLAAAKAVLYARLHALDGHSYSSVQFRRADVEWGALTRWTAYDARADVVGARRVNAWTGSDLPLMTVRRSMDDPLVARSREFAAVRNFVAAHGVTFATVIDRGAEGTLVLWSDLRYCRPVDVRLPASAPLTLAGGSPVSCAFWFGGEFDTAGVPTASVVYVGSVVRRGIIRRADAAHEHVRERRAVAHRLNTGPQAVPRQQ
jgi:membrane-bound metal-dependent hydrolase YbcI (DUF457 family)